MSSYVLRRSHNFYLCIFIDLTSELIKSTLSLIHTLYNMTQLKCATVNVPINNTTRDNFFCCDLILISIHDLNLNWVNREKISCYLPI